MCVDPRQHWRMQCWQRLTAAWIGVAVWGDAVQDVAPSVPQQVDKHVGKVPDAGSDVRDTGPAHVSHSKRVTGTSVAQAYGSLRRSMQH